MRTMVTGGAGFIGSTLVDRLLAEGHEVDVVDDLSTGSLANLGEARTLAGRALTIHQLDVRLPETAGLIARRRPEVIFHLAAREEQRDPVEDPVLDADVNVLGSLRVLEGARAAGTDRVVFAASAGIYGDVEPGKLPVRESQPRRPGTPKGVAKNAVVDYLVAYRELHALEFCTLVLANVYGPRQSTAEGAGVVASFADAMLRGAGVTIYGDGEQTRDFVFVDDVVDALARAATKAGGLVCNVGTGIETTVNDLCRTVEAIAGSEVAIEHVDARPGELRRIVLDPTRARIHLGWRPWTQLGDGVGTLIESVRRHRSDSAPATRAADRR